LCSSLVAGYAAAVGVAMMITILLIAFAGLLPPAFFLIRRGRLPGRIPLDELVGHMRPVDVEAFSNLVDPEEESFLRSNLPGPLFRSIQRERLLAATEYVAAVSHNAAVLLRIGEAARHHVDPTVSEAGQEMANSAARLRLHCSLLSLRLWTAILVPGAGFTSASLVERYQHLSSLSRRLGQLRYPAKVPRVSAAG
jgi:hypothetical protein